MMAVELSIILKDSERTYKQKFLVYDPISLHTGDPTLDNCLKEALGNYVGGNVEDIIVKATLVVK